MLAAMSDKLSRWLGTLKRLLVGTPTVATTQMEEQRLPKTIALAVFSSDALSSTAYATEEILFVVAVGASSLALGLSKLVPIAIVVAVLLAIVIVSYRQVIFAYPDGGGAYVVSKENLGEYAGARRRRVAHGRLRPHGRGLDLGRRRRDHLDPRVREPARASRRTRRRADRAHHAAEHARRQRIGPHLRDPHVPLHAGARRPDDLRTRPFVLRPHRTRAVRPGAARRVPARGGGTLALFLLLKGFSSGAVALTGVEAISNGVPSFRRPEAEERGDDAGVDGRAPRQPVLRYLGARPPTAAVPEPRQHGHRPTRPPRSSGTDRCSCCSSSRPRRSSCWPRTPPTTASRVCRRSSPTTATSRASSRTAATGSCSRTASSCSPARRRCSSIAFGGLTNALIPLYAVGVFTSFTLSPVRAWCATTSGCGEPGWRRNVVLNATGGVATLVVLLDRRDHQVHRRRVGADRGHPADRAAVQGHLSPLHAGRRRTVGARRLPAAETAPHRRGARLRADPRRRARRARLRALDLARSPARRDRRGADGHEAEHRREALGGARDRGSARDRSIGNAASSPRRC